MFPAPPLPEDCWVEGWFVGRVLGRVRGRLTKESLPRETERSLEMVDAVSDMAGRGRLRLTKCAGASRAKGNQGEREETRNKAGGRAESCETRVCLFDWESDERRRD